MRVFLETARNGSVSVAAHLCNLSQPAATQAIKQLELRFETQLFARKEKKFRLTAAGALFATRAQAAMGHLKEGAEAALRASGKSGAKARARETFELAVTPAQLRSLIAIANVRNFSIAARMLRLSQPTVHRTARTLESVAGVPFFIASPSGVRLTPAAEAFVLGAKLAQSELQQAAQEISLELGKESGVFVLGSLPLARTVIVPRAIHKMISTVPGFQVRVVEGRYTELLRSLREGELDCLIGALRHPLPADDVAQEVLFSDALAIVAHPSHPLAGRRHLRLEDTLAYPWIAPPKETPAGQYLFETLRIKDQTATPVRVVSSSMAVLRGVLAEGPYVSVVSRHQITIDADLGAIAALEVPLQGHIRDIGLTCRLGWRPTKTQERFIQYLREMSRLARPPEGL